MSVGLPGYIGTNAGAVPPMGVESGNNLYLLAKRMNLERQRSLPNPYPYWPGRDASPMATKSEMVPESVASHPKLLSSMTDNSRQSPNPNVDLMSILGGISDRSSSAVSNGANGWSNFPVQGGLDPLQNKLDLQHGPNVPPQAALGIQPQRLQMPNQPSLTNLLAQAMDNPSGVLAPEKLLSSTLPQDPQILNMLQQQYLMQLHSQATVPAQQLLLLDKLLLLKKQEEQQQLLLQQRQQLISQVLSDHHSNQIFSQSAAMAVGNAAVDHSRLQTPQELFQISSQIPPASTMQDERTTNLASAPLQVTQDANYNVSSEGSYLHLPHQIIGSNIRQKSYGTIVPEQIEDNQHKESLPASAVIDGSSLLLSTDPKKPSALQNSTLTSDGKAAENLEEKLQDTLIINEHVTVASSVGGANSVPLKSSGNFVDMLSENKALNDTEVLPDVTSVEPQIEKERCNDGLSVETESKSVEVREVRKASEKRTRKQKSSKSQSSLDQAKGVSKTISLQQPKQSDTEGTVVCDTKPETQVSPGEPIYGTSPQKGSDKKSNNAITESLGSQQVSAPSSVGIVRDDSETTEGKSEPQLLGSVPVQNAQGHSGLRAWKHAPGFKAKSLLEIQEEEQRKAKADTVVSETPLPATNAMSSSSPWSAVISNSDTKSSREIHQEASVAELSLGKSESFPNTAKAKKSQLHDLLAEEVLAKSSEQDMKIPDNISSLSLLSVISTGSDAIDDDNFIEAKDTKKSRKKSAKAKGAAAKVSAPSASVDLSVGSSPVEKGKISRSVQLEKEVLPVPSSGPSLGDFVPWKGESVNPSPAAAWSTDSGKLLKPTSLRDIQKEQGKRTSSVQNQIQIPTPQKSQPTQITRGSGPSWSIPASSPSKASPIQINSHSSALSKSREDDLFWGPIDQSKHDSKQYDFFL